MKNNWCIKGCPELKEWVRQQEANGDQSVRNIVGSDPSDYYYINDNSYWAYCCGQKGNKEVITFQQFLDMNKKIIGYIVKPEFKDVAAKVTDVAVFPNYDGKYHFQHNSSIYNTLKELKVLNLWCTEVYESKPEFKVGDIVVVTERHSNNPSKAGDIVEIRKIDDTYIPYFVYNKRENACDWCKNVRKATEAEIEQYNGKSKIFTINCDKPFEVEVSKQGIFYKNEDVWICPIDIGELLSISDDYSIQYDKVKINGASKKWDISINTVNIGCKNNCNIVDIKSVFDYYRSLQ